MRKFKMTITFFLAAAFLLATGCTKPINIKESFSQGSFPLTKQTEHFSGSVSISKKGAIFDSSVRNPLLIIENISSSIVNKGIIEIQAKNTSNISTLKVEFITTADGVWGSGKESQLEITPSQDYKTYTLDMSGVYGYLGTLIGLRLSCQSISEGEMVIKSVALKEGGENYPEGMSIGDAEPVYDFKQRVAKGIGYAPDGTLGFWKDNNGKTNFVASLMGKIILSQGSAEDPFEKIIYKDGEIDNVDSSKYHYASIAQVIKVPDSDILIGMTHLEYLLTNNKFNGVLGLSVSSDNGQTWSLLGEIISHTIPMDVDVGYSRDIGNGIIMLDEEYLYVYAIDWAENKNGLSISRVKLTELYDSVKQNKVPVFHKKYNNNWNEKGLGGEFDSVLPPNMGANFCQVVYQPTLKKYLMFITHSKYSANSADIALLVSESLDDFTDSEPYYVGQSQYGEQYPTVIPIDAASQTEVGDEFYLYYCHMTKGYQGGLDWQLFWGSCIYKRQKITIKGK